MNALEYSTATFERHLPSSVACSASDTSETSLGLLPVSPSSESSWRQKKKKKFLHFFGEPREHGEISMDWRWVISTVQYLWTHLLLRWRWTVEKVVRIWGHSFEVLGKYFHEFILLNRSMIHLNAAQETQSNSLNEVKKHIIKNNSLTERLSHLYDPVELWINLTFWLRLKERQREF